MEKKNGEVQVKLVTLQREIWNEPGVVFDDEEIGLRDACFFFQVEHGIRDIGVTGVQTCALPICEDECARRAGASDDDGNRRRLTATRSLRSEERRVGKEGRSRWSPYH